MKKLFLAAVIVMFSLALINCGGGKLTNDSAKDIFVEKFEKTIEEAVKAAGDISDEEKAEAEKKIKELKDNIKVTNTKEAEDGKSGSADFEMTGNDSTVELTFHFAKVDGNWEIKAIGAQGIKMPAENFFESMASSIGKGKVNATMADMRSVGVAIQAYILDNMFAPQVASITELQDCLVPFYIKTMPTTDGWGNNYHYKVGEFGPDQESYFIGSGGSDGKFDGFDQTGTHSGSKEKDIIYANGDFVYYPN